MNIYIVDDEPIQLKVLNRAVTEAEPNAEILQFNCAEDLLEQLNQKCSPPDVVFLDIELPGMAGLELAYCIKKIIPLCNVVFVTGFSQYAQEAYALRPSGYIMKPATKEKIRTELDNLRNPPNRTVPNKKIRVQCFGDFEIFVNESPVPFARAKSKELLAYLVDRRGVHCKPPIIASVIWEDGVYDSARQKLLSIVRADLIKSLAKVDAECIIKNDRNGISVIPDKFDCDYYMALSGDVVSVNSFTGEYMSAYTWAEFTEGTLASMFFRK